MLYIFQVSAILFILFHKHDRGYACSSTEYEIDGRCCPLCSCGTRLYQDCTGNTTTICVSCVGSTFTDKLNHIIKCQSCTMCDPGFGLKTVKECTASSDTFIKYPGTGSADAECENCPENSYSNGSSTSCT
ncbi:tumor necrosis factor receptor superfamily member 5-like isoform X1, partial [Arapaima gigas]